MVKKKAARKRSASTAPASRSLKREAGGTARVEVRIDRALKRKWDAAQAALKEASQQGASAFDVKYETLGEILDHDPPLYLAGGYSSERAYLAAEIGEDERTVRRWIRVAKYASPRDEERYGVTKLDEVLRYLDAVSGGELEGRLPVSLGELRIPAERDGARRRLTLEQATSAEIRAATRAKSKRPSKSESAPAARAVSAALRANGLRDVEVRVVKGKLRLGAIPLEALGALAKALSAVELPS